MSEVIDLLGTSPPTDEEMLLQERAYRRGYYDGYRKAIQDAEATKANGFKRFKEVCNTLWHFLENKLLPWRAEKMPTLKKPPELPDITWSEIREAVLDKDIHRCCVCLRRPRNSSNLHVHHVHPVKDGGVATMENLKVVCQSCHIELHS